ncbi:hypothetical protein GCM10027614_36810 [Micromonospora vulcania]
MASCPTKHGLGGLEEAGEEAGVSLATQAYQNSTGRAHGLDLTDLGASAVGGLAGGAVAPLAGLGRHATGRGARIGEHLGREMTGEMLAESAASIATGQGPASMEDAVRAAASGATGSATTQADKALHTRLDAQTNALAGASLNGPSLAPPVAATDVTAAPVASPVIPVQTSAATAVDATLASAPTELAPDRAAPLHGELPSSGAAPGVDVAADPTLPAVAADPTLSSVAAPATGTLDPASGPAAGAGPGNLASGPHSTAPGPVASTITGPAVAGPAATGPVVNGPVVTGPAVAGPVAPTVTGPAAWSSATGTPAPSVSPGQPVPTTSAGPAATTGAGPAQPDTSTGTAPPVAFNGSGGGTPSTVAPSSGGTVTGTWGTSVIGSAVGRSAVRIREALAPVRVPDHPARGRASIPAQAAAFDDQSLPAPEHSDWYAARWAAEADAVERRRYQGYYESQRTWFENNRRQSEAIRLRAQAAEHNRRAAEYASYARQLRQGGHPRWADGWQRTAYDEARAYTDCHDLADAVLAGTTAPPVVDIGAAHFRQANEDVGALALGAVETGNRSRLTGDDVPPPSDDSRPYGRPGGLRPPLALHQVDVERQVPRERDGTVTRTADPRRGGWLRLLNDGGPRADATRGINCLDCTLSLYETWVHGRPGCRRRVPSTATWKVTPGGRSVARRAARAGWRT